MARSMTTAQRRAMILAQVEIGDMLERETDATNRATLRNAAAQAEAAIDASDCGERLAQWQAVKARALAAQAAQWPGHVYGDGFPDSRRVRAALRSGKRV